MRILVLILAGFLSACSVSTQSITYTNTAPQMSFAEDFFVDEVKSCGSEITQTKLNFAKEIIGIEPTQLYNSTSLTVNWNYIGDRILTQLDMAYYVASNKDQIGAEKLLQIVEQAADSNLFYDWENWQDVAGKSCWKGPDGKCAYHHPEFATQAFAGMMLTAIVLEEYATPEQKKKFDTYFEKMHKRFVFPQAFNDWSSGFYAGANGGIANLAYARWTRDEFLFKKEITYRKMIIRKHFRKDGWIENNSWRGNRDYWYHTLGVDSVLGYMIIARSNGFDLFNDTQIGPRVYASIEKTLLGNVSLEEFSRKGYKGKNHITGAKDARPHMHGEATNLIPIVENEYGISIKPRMSYYRSQVGQVMVNSASGFNASCYYKSK